MVRPAVTAETELEYSRWPEVYRVADDDPAIAPDVPGADFPLLRYLASTTDQTQPVADLLGRLATDLADPELADNGWLPWLSQPLGVVLNLADPDGWRAALLGREYEHGTEAAMAALMRPLLTGTQTLEFDREGVGVSSFGAPGDTFGGPAPASFGDLSGGVETGSTAPFQAWTLGVGTLHTETPVATVELLAAAAPEKPAGLRLVHYWLDLIAVIDGGDADGPWADELDAGDADGGFVEEVDGGGA